MTNQPDPETLRGEAWRLLRRIASAPPTEALVLVDALRPADEDYGRAFLGSAADQARAGYRSLWSTPVIPGPKVGQTELRVAVARVEDLRERGEAAERLPGGYGQIADKLVPGRVWVAWKFTEPGEALGMAWDGLVWLDDHWAWFPKPWRVLAPVEGV